MRTDSIVPKCTGKALIFVLFTSAVVLTLGSCSSPSEIPAADYVIDFTDGFQQSDADAILHDCGASDVTLQVKSDGEIFFKPDLDADYESAACVLQHIKESGTTKFGFVGNEKYVTPDESE